MNTSVLTFITADIVRLRYRWTFDQPQSLSPELQYKSRLEVMEFDCSQRKARPYHITFFNGAGTILRTEDAPGKWRNVSAGSMMEKLFAPACELVKSKLHPPVIDREKEELENAEKFGFLFAQELQRSKDFKTVVRKFFATDYLSGYLQDNERKWFHNLDQATAARVNRGELERFYIALMNTGYLNSVYLMSQLSSESDRNLSPDKLLPPDVLQVINSHPYGANYKGDGGRYGFLEAKISTAAQLRSYTSLLEEIALSMRRHVVKVRVEHSIYGEAPEGWQLYSPRVSICARTCLGLPRGTKLFQIDVPVFKLQLAEVGGQLKVVSAISSFD